MKGSFKWPLEMRETQSFLKGPYMWLKSECKVFSLQMLTFLCKNNDSKLWSLDIIYYEINKFISWNASLLVLLE